MPDAAPGETPAEPSAAKAGSGELPPAGFLLLLAFGALASLLALVFAATSHGRFLFAPSAWLAPVLLLLGAACAQPPAPAPSAPEPTFDVKHVADAVLYMAGLPLDANVQFMTVMATKMPFVGRG